MTTQPSSPASAPCRLRIVPLGLTVGSFLVITYLLCVLFGLFVSDTGIHRLFGLVFPGFTWITWPSFFVGLIWAFAYGWFVALLFVPLFNVFKGRTK